MEISRHILEEAKKLLQSGVALAQPVQLNSAPEFYLAKGDDSTITAFTAIMHEGVEFKIGPKKIN